MKKYLKDLLPAIILSLLISYNINIYEPILTYSSNILDFWFDFKTMIRYSLLVFLIMLIFLLFIYTVIYFINNKWFKNKKIFEIIMIISYIVYFVSYIQGNYLIGSLPELNGQEIIYSGHFLDNIISFTILIVLISVYVICVRKYKIEKVINISKYVSLAVFVMLFVSMISVLLTTENVFMEKKAIATSYDGINYASSDSNFYLLLLDAVDSRSFYNVLEDRNYKDKFKDFVYYIDTVGENESTRYAVPFILSGIPYKGEKNYYEYFDNSMNNSELVNKLIDNNYKIYMYEEDLEWTTDKVDNLNNFVRIDRKMDLYRYFVQIAKLDGFKYLVYPLKKLAKVENVDFNLCRINKGEGSFTWYNLDAYNRFNNDKLNLIEDKYFNYMHLEGGHLPHKVDCNFKRVDNGNYDDKLETNMKLIDSFIKRLKDNNVYDNSVIVILADHGFCVEGNTDCDRLNPLLMIKGRNEHHDLIKSDKAISYLDLSDAFVDLINNKKSTDLFKNIGNKRTRYSFNGYKDGKYLVTEHYDKAWERKNNKIKEIENYK